MPLSGSFYYEVHKYIVTHFTSVRKGIAELNGNANDYYIYLSCILAASSDALREAALQPADASFKIECRLTCSSISGMTGLPRETVRRHLLRLTELNLLKVNSSGTYSACLDIEDIAKYIPRVREAA